MTDHITHDPAYDTVAADDFAAMIEVPRYGRRSAAFDAITQPYAQRVGLVDGHHRYRRRMPARQHAAQRARCEPDQAQCDQATRRPVQAAQPDNGQQQGYCQRPDAPAQRAVWRNDDFKPPVPWR